MVSDVRPAATEMPELIGPCASCGELVRAGVAPEQCVHGGSGDCAVVVPEDPAEAENDPLGRTIVFVRETPRRDASDGFPEVEDLIDRTLGQYRIGPRIGQGTMGRVYRAEHRGLGRPCAIKVMDPSLVVREPLVVDQFWAEARAMAGLVHPHIVTVHNLGADRGYHFIEMELVEHRRPYWRKSRGDDGAVHRDFVPGGVSVTEKIVREGPMNAERAATIVREVALALDAAHDAGLVHRDVKPANVLLTAAGRSKLADFGLARRVADVDRPGGRGRLAGTPTFMAPELFSGAAPGPATDLYAVGVMFFYLLSARLPYTSDRLGTLVRLHQRAPVPDVRSVAEDVPAEVGEIVKQLLAKSPSERYGSAGALAADLRSVLGYLRNTEALVSEAIEGLGGLVQQGGRDRFRVVLPVPGDRVQEVYLENAEGRKGERLLSIFSVCGPADPRHYEYALKLNAELTHGSISIRTVDAQPMFVMTRTFARGHVTPADIRAAVKEIARHSDRVEEQLVGTDLF